MHGSMKMSRQMKRREKRSDDFMRALLTQTVVNDNEIKIMRAKICESGDLFSTDDM